MDELILTTASHLLDITDNQLQQPDIIRQLQAPLRYGGYGLTSAVQAPRTDHIILQFCRACLCLTSDSAFYPGHHHLHCHPPHHHSSLCSNST